jgi:hypothetical protein
MGKRRKTSMDGIVSFVWLLAPDWLVDRLEDIFRAPFWKVMAGVMIATLSLVALSALPSAARNKLKLAVVFGALAFAAFDLFRGFPLG